MNQGCCKVHRLEAKYHSFWRCLGSSVLTEGLRHNIGEYCRTPALTLSWYTALARSFAGTWSSSTAFLRITHHTPTMKIRELLFCFTNARSEQALWCRGPRLQATLDTRAVLPASHKLHVYLRTHSFQNLFLQQTREWLIFSRCPSESGL